MQERSEDVHDRIDFHLVLLSARRAVDWNLLESRVQYEGLDYSQAPPRVLYKFLLVAWGCLVEIAMNNLAQSRP